MYVHHMSIVPSEDIGVRSPKSEMVDSCEPTCGCWEQNPDPMKDNPVLNYLSGSQCCFVNMIIKQFIALPCPSFAHSFHGFVSLIILANKYL